MSVSSINMRSKPLPTRITRLIYYFIQSAIEVCLRQLKLDFTSLKLMTFSFQHQVPPHSLVLRRRNRILHLYKTGDHVGGLKQKAIQVK